MHALTELLLWSGQKAKDASLNIQRMQGQQVHGWFHTGKMLTHVLPWLGALGQVHTGDGVHYLDQPLSPL